MQINDELVNIFLGAYRHSFYELEEPEQTATRKGIAALFEFVQAADAEVEASERMTRELDQAEAVKLQGVLMRDYALYRPMDGGGLMSWAANALEYRQKPAAPSVQVHGLRYAVQAPGAPLGVSVGAAIQAIQEGRAGYQPEGPKQPAKPPRNR